MLSKHQKIPLLYFFLVTWLKCTATEACDNFNITHSVHGTSISISFSSNEILKADRRVMCPSTSVWASVEGCSHTCDNLQTDANYEATVELRFSNNSVLVCFIRNDSKLEAPTLETFNVADDRVYLTVRSPLSGTFDYFLIRCPMGEVWNSTSTGLVTANCSTINDLSLMNVILESFKGEFDSATRNIIQEVPRPVPFHYTLNGRRLEISASPPPPINNPSSYDFTLRFYQNNEIYVQDRMIDLISTLGINLTYYLLPDVLYEINFEHRMGSIGSAHSRATLTAVMNLKYPFPAGNLRVRESFNNIYVTWNDTHDPMDMIDFIVICNSNNNISENVGRSTSYVCREMMFNETNDIRVLTQVSIRGYTQQNLVETKVDVRGVPQLPMLTIDNQTDASITIRWNSSALDLGSSVFTYGIECGFQEAIQSVNIQSNQYQCQSLSPATLYTISLVATNPNNDVQRVESINGHTMIPTVRLNDVFYQIDQMAIRSVVLEWIPSAGIYDKIELICPSFNLTYEYIRFVSIMHSKCTINNMNPIDVRFITYKSGYENAIATYTLSPTNTSTTSTSPPTATGTTTTTGTGTTGTTTTTTTTTGTATVGNGSTPTIINSSSSTTTSNSGPNSSTSTSSTLTSTTATGLSSPSSLLSSTTTTTITSTQPTNVMSTISSVTTAVGVSTTSTTPVILTTQPHSCSSCESQLVEKENEISKWRITAIIALILAGVLLIITAFTVSLVIIKSFRNSK